MSKLLFETYRTDVDLAEEIGCHVRTLHRAIKRGEIVGTKLGRLHLIDVRASRAALQARASRKKGRAAK